MQMRRISSVSGDGAYDTKACHAAIARRNAQAIIPPHKNAKAWKSTQSGSASRSADLLAIRVSNQEEVGRLPPTQSWPGRLRIR